MPNTKNLGLGQKWLKNKEQMISCDIDVNIDVAYSSHDIYHPKLNQEF